MAEGVGFEPTEHFLGALPISSRVPLATQPPLRMGGKTCHKLQGPSPVCNLNFSIPRKLCEPIRPNP